MFHDLLCILCSHLSELLSFGCRNPSKTDSLIFQSQIFEDFFYDSNSSSRMIITNLVMTISRMSATDQNTVCTTQKGFDQEDGIYPAGAHHFDGNYCGRVLESVYSCQICSCVGTPFTQKTYNFGREFFFHNKTPFTLNVQPMNKEFPIFKFFIKLVLLPVFFCCFNTRK